MRTLLPAVAMIALAGLGGAAQAQCPELTRLRSEAVEATKPMNRGLMPDRCDAYIPASLAWSTLSAYAQDHQEKCDISSRSLSEIDKLSTTTQWWPATMSALAVPNAKSCFTRVFDARWHCCAEPESNAEMPMPIQGKKPAREAAAKKSARSQRKSA